jgi:citrate lyase subunit beta / citryl-CoA lyase
VTTTSARSVPRVRSALFVPGTRDDFVAKADTRGADAVIFDLEDSVAEGRLDDARELVGGWIHDRTSRVGPVVCVRVNALPEARLDGDLDAIVHDAITVVVVPKITHEDEVVEVAEALAHVEGRRGLRRGHVRIWPLVETAEAVQRADRIASASPRVAYMGGGTSRQGDIARALGFRWTPEGLETLFVRSKVLVDVRAAGVPNPISGLVSNLADPSDLETFARQSRGLGYEGLMVIHPAQVALVNDVFSPTDEERRDAREMMTALADAEARGLGAVTHRGRMIDRAMGDTLRAQGLLDDDGAVEGG